jgi:hypothetical protein
MPSKDGWALILVLMFTQLMFGRYLETAEAGETEYLRGIIGADFSGLLGPGPDPGPILEQARYDREFRSIVDAY